jgi:hypothetical protein
MTGRRRDKSSRQRKQRLRMLPESQQWVSWTASIDFAITKANRLAPNIKNMLTKEELNNESVPRHV